MDKVLQDSLEALKSRHEKELADLKNRYEEQKKELQTKYDQEDVIVKHEIKQVKEA